MSAKHGDLSALMKIKEEPENPRSVPVWVLAAVAFAACLMRLVYIGI
jgi:hypothetical protein